MVKVVVIVNSCAYHCVVVMVVAVISYGYGYGCGYGYVCILDFVSSLIRREMCPIKPIATIKHQSVFFTLFTDYQKVVLLCLTAIINIRNKKAKPVY